MALMELLSAADGASRSGRTSLTSVSVARAVAALAALLASSRSGFDVSNAAAWVNVGCASDGGALACAGTVGASATTSNTPVPSTFSFRYRGSGLRFITIPLC